MCTCVRIQICPHVLECACFVCPPAYAATFLGLWTATAARLRAAGPGKGNPFAEGLNYFAPRETGPRPHSAVDLGGKGPISKLELGKPGGAGARVRAQMAPPRA